MGFDILMSDCTSCHLRLETCQGHVAPFCANEECKNFDKKAMSKAIAYIKRLNR